MAEDQTTKDELRLLNSFRELGVIPKADTKEVLEGWMKDHVAAGTETKQDPDH